MNAIEIITKKKNGEKLTTNEIKYFFGAYTRGEIPDYQMSAFLMAYYFQDMVLDNQYSDELAQITLEVSESGSVLDFSNEFELLFDKHSTGGVGDKLSFICAPIMAAAGCPSLLLSGRGLGHTGGTLDKLESIPGMKVELNKKEIIKALNNSQLVICGQTSDIAPLDKKLYALRDVTSTVNSVGLISASILGKKLSIKPTCLVLDVKTGSGAFMQTFEDSKRLATSMMGILKNVKRPAAALITNMDQPLGRMVGNSLEIIESVNALRNPKDPDFQDIIEISVQLAANAILLGKKVNNLEEAVQLSRKVLNNGKAFEAFSKFVDAQGGDANYLSHLEKFPKTKSQKTLIAKKNGFMKSMNSLDIGISSNLLGAGRFKKEDRVDLSVGIQIHKKIGDEIKIGEKIFTLFINSETNLPEIIEKLESSYVISEDKIEKPKNIFEVIS